MVGSGQSENFAFWLMVRQNWSKRLPRGPSATSTHFLNLIQLINFIIEAEQYFQPSFMILSFSF